MIPDHLKTANLHMRPFASGDGSAVYAYWASDPGWEKFNTSVPSEFTEQDAINFVTEMISRDRAEQPSWALVQKERVVGVVSLSFKEGYRTASIGYGIHADLRGRGLCTEAAGTVLGSAFSEYPELEKICALTDARNVASIKVLKKLGFLQDQRSGDDGSAFCLRRTDWQTRNR